MALQLLEWGFSVFCPHSMTHGWEHAPQQFEDQVFLDLDLVILARCDVLFVLPGSHLSEGVKAEEALAERLGKPVFRCVDELQAAYP